jgi:uncharacterized protein YwlG (UPF0340 family)
MIHIGQHHSKCIGNIIFLDINCMYQKWAINMACHMFEYINNAMLHVLSGNECIDICVVPNVSNESTFDNNTMLRTNAGTIM